MVFDGNVDPNVSYKIGKIRQFKVENCGLLDGKGTITRRNTYVWPKLSGTFSLNRVWFGLIWVRFELGLV